MKKTIKIMAAVLAMTLVMGAAGCSAKSSTGTKDPTKLVMGTNSAFPPFEYLEGGAVVGVDADLMAAIAKQMGITLTISDMEFDSLPTALANGQIDVIAAGFTVSPDREETMDFSSPYYTAAQTIIVATNSTIATVNDLKDKKIGVQSGTTGQTDAAGLTSDANIKGFASGMLAVEALKNGQVDAVIIDNNPAKAYADENPDTIKLIEGQFAAEEYALAVKKGNSVLLNKINDALTKLKADGTFDAIISKYVK
jgi:polar amino acid transport system substrate-binding protein